MAIIWDQLPLEMRQAIVSEMDVKSRVNLSMCSKSENQLVRGTRYGKVKGIEINEYGFRIFFPRGYNGRNQCLSRRHKSSTVVDWLKIWNMMSLIGKRVEVEYLKLTPRKGFQELFNCLRRNFHIKPRSVTIYIDNRCCHDDSIFDWPSNTNVGLYVIQTKLPNLERFNTYDKIVMLYFVGNLRNFDVLVTDEELKKMRNAKDVFLENSDVTMNGFEWWLRNWLTRTDDNEQYTFDMKFYERRRDEFSFENITNKLSDVIGKTEIFSFYWKIEIKKNGKVGGIITLSDDILNFGSE